MGMECFHNNYFLNCNENKVMNIQFYRWLYKFQEYEICENILFKSIKETLSQVLTRHLQEVIILYASCLLNNQNDSTTKSKKFDSMMDTIKMRKHIKPCIKFYNRLKRIRSKLNVL